MPKHAAPITNAELKKLRAEAEANPSTNAKRADGEQRGLYVRARGGRVEFWYRGRGPARSWVYIDGYPAITLDAARKAAGKLRDLEAELRTTGGDLRAELEARRRKVLTVADIFAAYIADFQHRVDTGAKRGKASSLAEVKRVADRPELASLRKVPAGQVTPEHVRQIQAKLADRPGAANRTTTTLSTAFNFCVREGLVEANPFKRAQPLREPGARRALTRDELQALGTAIRETTDNPRLVLCVSFLAMTGFRRSELTGAPHNARETEALKWRDVDLETGIVTLRDSKTGPQRRVIGRAAIDLLKAYKPDDASPEDYIVPGEKSPAYRQFNHQRRRLWKRAGLPARKRGSAEPYCDLHSLRHSFASIGAHVADGRYAGLVSALMGHGHQSTAITERYIHQDPELLRPAADAISAEIARLLGLRAPADVVDIASRRA